MSVLEAIMEADYKKQVDIFNQEETKKNQIVFIGDSIINYWDTSKYFTNTNIINRGIAGDTAVGVLNRLDQIIKIEPSIIIIHVGSNDIVRTTNTNDEIVQTLLKIRYKLETNLPNTKIYIVSLPPVLRDHEITSTAYVQHRTNDIIEDINEKLLLFTEPIDTSSYLKDSDGNLKLNYTKDGIHLTHEGYKVLSKVIASEVTELKLIESDGN